MRPDRSDTRTSLPRRIRFAAMAASDGLGGAALLRMATQSVDTYSLVLLAAGCVLGTPWAVAHLSQRNAGLES